MRILSMSDYDRLSMLISCSLHAAWGSQFPTLSRRLVAHASIRFGHAVGGAGITFGVDAEILRAAFGNAG
jgi:hypothetical protein